MKSKPELLITEQNSIKYFEQIYQVSKALLDVQNEQEIYRILCKAISRILPEAYFVISKLMPDNKNFRIMESYGFDPFFNTIKKLVGKDPYTINFPLNKLTEDQKHSFDNRKMYYFSDGIYELTNGKINKTISKAIEKLLDIKVVCALSFSVDAKYYGGMSFFIPKSVDKTGRFNEDMVMYIETLSNLASAFIQKLRNQNDAMQYE